MNTPLTGYRTLIVATLGLIFAVLTVFGIVVPESDMAGVEVGVTAVVMIVMRLLSRTPAGTKPPIVVTEEGSATLPDGSG